MKQKNDDIKNDIRLNLRSEKTRRFIVESLPFLVRYGTIVIAIIVSPLFVVVFCLKYDDLPLGQYLFPQLY